MALTKITADVIENGAITSDKLASGAVSASSLSSITTDNVSEGSTNVYYTDTRARSSVSVTGGNLSYDSGTGVIQLTTDTIRGAISVTDAGGDGSLAYSAGVITYTGPSAAEVRAHFSGSTGISYNSSTGAFTTSAIPNASLSNSSITINSNSVDLGASVTLDTDDVGEGSTNLYYTDARVDSRLASGSVGNIVTTGYIAGPATFTIDPAAVGDNTGTVVIAGDLRVDGTTTTINSTTLTVDDKNILLGQGAALASDNNGAGITVDTANASITYDSTNDEWDFNKDINVVGINNLNTIDSSGSLTITLNDVDFVVRDTTDSIQNYIWRDHSGSKLYLGTPTAVATIRSTLDLNSNNITNAGTISSGAITSTTNGSGYALIIEENSGGEQYQIGTDVYGGLNFFNSGTKIAEFTDTGEFQLLDGGSPNAVQVKISPIGNSYFNGGNVGIGITSPEVPLDINFSDSTTYTSGIASGTAAYTPSYSANALQLKNTYTATDGNSVGIWFETTGAGNTGVERVGRIVFVNNADIDYGGDFAFQLRGAGGAGIAEVMRIASDGSGSVGIGTSTPASKLDVNGVVSLKGNDFLDSDTNSHYIKAPTHLYLYSNGTDLNFALNNLGNVGIGIASAVGQGNSDKILHLHNTTNNRTQIHLTNSGTGTTSTDGSYISIDNTNQLYFINKEAQGFYFENGTTNSMQINANNVVLIGGGTHSGANQTLGIGNTTGNDPGLQIRTSDGTGTAGYLFADTTESDNITLESASGTVNIAGYGGATMASVGSRPSGTWTETQLEIFNSAGNSAEFQLNSSNNIKIRFNDTDRATIDSNGNWTIEGENKYFNVDGFVEVGRGLTIDRANNNSAIWFTPNESDTNHVLWNGYNGNDPQTRGANNTGFDGMFWNVYRGLQIRGGTAGAVDCIKITNSSSNVADHAVRLYASGQEKLVTTTTGVNVTGTVSVGSVETMQILQHRQYSNHTGYNSTTTNSWISSGFTGTFTRLKSNSSIFIKANIAAGMALNADSAQNYAGVRVRIDMGNNNLVGDSTNYYLWLRMDVSTVTQHIKEVEGHIPLFYSVNEAAGYFGAAGTTTTFTVQYYNYPYAGSFNRGGINVWGNNSTIEIIEYDGGTLS